MIVGSDPALLESSPDAPAIASPDTLTLDVGGMKCAGCVKAVENQLTQQPGVLSATVNLVTEVAKVEYWSEVVAGQALATKLTESGFPTKVRWASAEPIDADDEPVPSPAEKQQQATRQYFRQVAIAAILLVFSAIGHLKHLGWDIPILGSIAFHGGLATLTLLVPARSIVVDGWRGLRRNTPNMNTLVSLGALTAYTTSIVALLVPSLGWECFFDEPVMLLGFILLGRALEQQARGRATSAFQALLSLQPTLARLIVAAEGNDGQKTWVELPADRIKVGESLEVLPGDKIPVDGTITLGTTTIDESMLTGESMPVLKQPGDSVAAGTLNQSGAIAIQATRTGDTTTLAQIIAMVEAAQTRKAPIQTLADTVAGYFTYGVMAIAALTFLFWYTIGIPLWHESIPALNHLGHSLEHSSLMAHAMQSPVIGPVMATAASPLLISLKLAIAVLVIACPCALGLATPTAILVGSSLGAERGILLRGGDVLETIHQLTTIVFDKTGTLTTGQPVITDCLALQPGLGDADLLQIAATVESGTRHPLATAILAKAQQQSLALLPATDFHTRPGYGVSATVAGQPVLLGTHTWLSQHGVEIPHSVEQQVAQLASAGKSLVYVAIAGQLAGIIAGLDELRPDASAMVEQLRQMGLRVRLLTGDHPAAAQAIATALHIPPEDVQANLHPQDKVAAITALQSQGERVAMVGDGINDAPALAQADVSISLHSGTDVAVETAEIVLIRDRLLDVVESIRLGRATFNKIRQNLFWAFGYNLIGIPIAAGVLLPSFGLILSPAIAGAFMAFSSVSVVTNSLLLRRSRPLT